MTDAPNNPPAALPRRALLSGGGLAAAAASVAMAVRTEPAQAFRATPAQKAARYQDSAHVERFYALNRR
jgi:hypothetical protein